MGTQSKGALLSAAPGSTGTRTVSFNDSLGLIVGQSVSRVPHQAQITEWHPVDPRAVAITFDDGPDPVYTAKILDILAEKGAKATFYVIGRNALRYPELLRRMYAEGHDVGGHSFSHENIFQSSDERIKLELNAVQRIFEAQLGINSILLRAPYAWTSFRYLDEAPQLVATASRLGYLHANIEADGFDWVWTAPSIVKRVVTEVVEGRGQVLLLHDAGGTRRATLEALPQIIDQPQAKGFRFVSTHELVGKSRNELMPPVAWAMAVSEAQSMFGLAYVRTVAWFGEIIPVVAISTAALGMVRLSLIVLGACVQKRRSRRRRPSGWRPAAGVAVLVPAYNEETVICKTVETLLASALEADIIVIDDGSSDRTSDVVRETYAGVERVKVYRKENGGKAAALNFGIAQTDAEVIVAIDGDTVLLPDAIERLVEPFEDPRVGAVAGKVVVGNRVNLMTRFQALEYLMSQNLDRRAFELFNAIGVVPGAIGAWRRAALVEVGGYSHDTLAEDADLTWALQRHGWRIIGEPGALALTEAPETVKAFLKQRFRWMFGTLQVAYKNAGALLGRPCGISLITIPNVFLFQYAFTLLAPIMDLLLLWTVMMQVRSLVLFGSAQAGTSLMLLEYWIFFQSFDVLAAAAAMAFDRGRAEWRLVPLLILQRFSYRQLLYWAAVRTLLAAIKGSFVGWGKLIRTGSVSLPVQTKGAG